MKNNIKEIVSAGVSNKHAKFVVEESYSGDGGVCVARKFGKISEGGRQTTAIKVPLGSTDLDAVIRWHELLHSKFSAHLPIGTSLADNCAEDAVIHSMQAKADFSHLDEKILKVGISDLRQGVSAVKVATNPSHIEFSRSLILRGLFLLIGQRTSMLQKSSTPKVDRIERILRKVFERVGSHKNILKQDSSFDFNNFVHKSRREIDNIRLDLPEMIRSANALKQMKDGGACSLSASYTLELVRYNSNRRRYLKAVKKLRQLFHDAIETGGESERKAMEKKGEAIATEGAAIFKEPPRTSQCTTAKARGFIPSSTGSIINGARLAKALVGCASVFLKRRQAKRPPTAIMIDMSGSMAWGKEELEEVCRLLPSCTVYGYSNWHRSSKTDGTIFLMAKNGLRVDSAPPSGGGNGCDLQAVRKLLTHQGNVVLVSDLGFCGQTQERTDEAFRLVRMHDKTRLKVFDSTQGFIQFLREKAKKGW